MAVFTTPRAPRGAAQRHERRVRIRTASSATSTLLAVCVLLAATACERRDAGDAARAVAVTDDVGREVALPHPARRVVSLIPAQTQIVVQLAGADVLVARTQWDLDPALAHLPSAGNALTPSIEWIAALRPELVVAWPDAQSRDVVHRLEDIGIPVFASRVESVADVHATIARLGTLLGRDAEAAALSASLDAQLDSVRAFAAAHPTRSVLYLLNADPPMAAGPGTFVDELITVAGGRNIFADMRQLWPQVSLEEIVRRQPDVIIRPTEGALHDPLAGLGSRPGWRELAAVRAGRVHGVDPNLYNRPGPGMGEAARGLAERIHGAAAAPQAGPDGH